MSTDQAALYRLMVWLSPSFPVGAFSYSHGLEWLVETRAVADEPSLGAWVCDVVSHGSGLTDAILFCHAWRATGVAELREIAELAAALAPTSERHLETTAQGDAFCDTVIKAWPAPTLVALREAWDGPLAYPVAVACVVRDHGIALEPALLALLHASTANLVSAGVRLIPLGQTAGQRITAALEGPITNILTRALDAPLDAIGSSLLLTDIASMRHETQYTRLFRS